MIKVLFFSSFVNIFFITFLCPLPEHHPLVAFLARAQVKGAVLEITGRDLEIRVGDLLIVYISASALNQPPGLAVGGAHSGVHEQLHDPELFRKQRPGERDGRQFGPRFRPDFDDVGGRPDFHIRIG